MIIWEYTTRILKQKSNIWGYKSDFLINAEIIEQKLNELGQEGWELVSSTPNSELFGLTTQVLLIFKRIKS